MAFVFAGVSPSRMDRRSWEAMKAFFAETLR
jgi:hypothetical protein